LTVGATTFKIGGMTCTFAVFKPTEMGKITGLSPDLQRVWKRRGQLPWGNGEPAPFTAPVAAEMFVRHQLSLNGLPPGDSAEIGGGSAAIVFWFALLNVDGACEVVGPPEAVNQFLESFGSDSELVNELTGSPPIHQFLYRYDGAGEFRRGKEMQEIVGSANFSSLALIDLEDIAMKLCARAKRPLITVELSDCSASPAKIIRRLTAG